MPLPDRFFNSCLSGPSRSEITGFAPVSGATNHSMTTQSEQCRSGKKLTPELIDWLWGAGCKTVSIIEYVDAVSSKELKVCMFFPNKYILFNGWPTNMAGYFYESRYWLVSWPIRCLLHTPPFSHHFLNLRRLGAHAPASFVPETARFVVSQSRKILNSALFLAIMVLLKFTLAHFAQLTAASGSIHSGPNWFFQ